MPESFRSACRTLLQYLYALLELLGAASSALLARLQPGLAALRSAVRSGVERLPDLLAFLRYHGSNLLRRLADAIAPQAYAPAPEVRADDGQQDFAQMLADLGAEPPPREQGADSTLKDTTIRALSHDLHGLRDLGDQLARAEQDKLALAARVAELEAAVGSNAHGENGVVARLERELGQREGLLARTREQLARQRAKTDDWKRKASERWHEIGSLRKQVKKLERSVSEARARTQPGPLPKRPAS